MVVTNLRIKARVLILSGTLFGPLSPRAEAISWQDIKSMAANSPRMKSSEADVHEAAASSDAARAVYFPKIYSSFESRRSVDTGSRDSANGHTASLNIEQGLFSFGKDRATVNAAERTLEAARQTKKALSVSFRAELARAWTSTLYYQRLSALSAKVVERRTSNIQIVRLRYNSGRESKGSLLSTEYAGKEAVIDHKESVEKAKLARQALSSLVSSDIPPDEALTGSLIGPETETRDANALNLPQVQAARSKVDAALARQSATRRKYLPDLTLSASAKKSAAPDLPLKDPVYAGAITLYVPLFDAKLDADQRAAAASLAGSEADLAALTAASGQNLKTAKLDRDLARERLESAKLGYEAAKLQAEVSRQRYTLGLMSFQDWDSFESAFIKAENKMLEQEKTLAEANISYLEASGVSLEDSP